MREFWRLGYDPDPRFAYVEDYDLGSFDDGDTILAGKCPDGGMPPHVKLEVDTSGEWPDLMKNPLHWIIVSDKLRKILLPYWNGGAFCEIRLQASRSGEVLKGFWLGVIGRRVECMDREKSDFRERSGRLVSLSHLVVAASKVPEDVHVFTLPELPRRVIVDGIVKTALAAGGATGLALVECGVSE
jgi:hypothetical protein